MNPFPLSSRGAVFFDEIRRQKPCLDLTFGPPARGADRIDAEGDVELLGGPIRDARLARAARAGLLLFADCFDASHRVSQALETPEGAYWHGILHRREPDPPNAKYWLRQVGDHRLWSVLASPPPGGALAANAALGEVARNGRWDPCRLVDACAALELTAASGDHAAASPAGRRRQLQALADWEALALLSHCVAGALGHAGDAEGAA